MPEATSPTVPSAPAEVEYSRAGSVPRFPVVPVSTILNRVYGTRPSVDYRTADPESQLTPACHEALLDVVDAIHHVLVARINRYRQYRGSTIGEETDLAFILCIERNSGIPTRAAKRY